MNIDTDTQWAYWAGVQEYVETVWRLPTVSTLETQKGEDKANRIF